MTKEEYAKMLQQTKMDVANMSEEEVRRHLISAIVNWHTVIDAQNQIEREHNKLKQTSGIKIKKLEEDLEQAREIAEQYAEELQEKLKYERPWATFDPLPWRKDEEQDS